jgi:hypothetical protein
MGPAVAILSACHFVGGDPILWDVVLIASAHGTAFGSTEFIHVGERAYRVEVESDQPEVFSLDELIQYLAGLVVNIPKDGGLGLRTQLVEG